MNYIEHLLNLTSTFTSCVSIYAFASVSGIPVQITSSTVGLKIRVKIVKIEKYKSVIRKKRKKNMIKEFFNFKNVK